jgi:hypothetical protein
MQYFNTLPKIVYTSPITNKSTAAINLLNRASIIPSIFLNPLLFYTYDVQEGDTPESVAFKYYGDVYRYWIVLFANQAFDPQWNWPLTSQQFLLYMQNKYENVAGGANNVISYTQSTVYEYQKIITQYEVNTKTTTINTVIIDESTYNSLPDFSNNTYYVSSGQVNVTVVRNILNIYDYENNLNESKRNIKIIDNNYVPKIEEELQNLMAK